MTVVVHLAHATAPPLPFRLAVALLAGFLAALVMNAPMLAFAEGYAPAHVAASVVWGTTPSKTGLGAAMLVHHVAGILAGLLHLLLALGLEQVLPVSTRVAGLPLVPHLVAGALVTAFLYGFFSWLVLPRFGAGVRDRAATVKGRWAVSALIFGWTLVAFVPTLVANLR